MNPTTMLMLANTTEIELAELARHRRLEAEARSGRPEPRTPRRSFLPAPIRRLVFRAI